MGTVLFERSMGTVLFATSRLAISTGFIG